MSKQKTWSMIWTDELKELEGSVKRVRELHEPVPCTDEGECCQICDYCGYVYPCMTIEALDGEQ